MQIVFPYVARWCAAAAVLVAAQGVAAQSVAAASEPAANDAAQLYERGRQHVYTGEARATIGMPCGGICAGQLYVLGDGTLGSWQIDGRTYFTGYGKECYRTYRPARPIEQGFALGVRDPNGVAICVTLDDEGYDAIEFVGEYPRALVRYRARQKRVPPVRVDLEVFSPFLPLNAKDSAWPATVCCFTLTNETDRKLGVVLGGWLENMLFPEFSRPITLRHINRVVRENGLTMVRMNADERRLPRTAQAPQTRVLADFESGTYEGWQVVGAAFGEAPASGTFENQQPVSGFGGQHLANSYVGGDGPTGRLIGKPFRIDAPFLLFRIGGGRHPGEACINLVVDDQVVRTQTGRNEERLELRGWDIRELLGREARIEIVDAHSGGWGHINVDDVVLAAGVPDELREFRTDATGYGTMALTAVGGAVASPQWDGQEAFVASLGGRAEPRSGLIERGFDERLIGTLRRGFPLPPGETREVTFIVSWHFPNLASGQRRVYSNWFSSAFDVAEKLAASLDRLHADTTRFCDVYYRETTLPWWLATRLMMPVSNLASGTAQWWDDGRFWAWEGVGCCPGTCTHVWNYAQAHAWLFPELARSARTMQDLGVALNKETGLVGFRSDDRFAADGQAGTILKCYREHLISRDGVFLRKNWTSIKLALDYLVSQDEDEDGIIVNDRQHNTYDINFVGANTLVGSLYLAALRAGEEMARFVGDEQSASRYRQIFERGRSWSVEHLFNGEYFEQRLPAGDEPPWQYGRGCLSDQLFGQTWAHMLGLGYLYPPEQTRSALAAVFRHNWSADIAALNVGFEPERRFASPGEAGLLLCTWPRGGRPEKPVRYRDEVWTGIEYQVAAGLVWEGLVDEGLRIVHGIDQRYDGVRHNPWNEVECGDHYARALASWSVLHALSGFTFDGPAGRLGFTPRFHPQDYAGFFCAGTGWGTLVQHRGPQIQVDSVVLAHGDLRLTGLDLEAPPDVRVRSVTAEVTSEAAGQLPYRELQPSLTQSGQGCQVRFEQPLELTADQRLNVELHW